LVSGFFYLLVEKGGDEQVKDVIAYRKTCTADGAGLSHYILMVAKAK
jgi:modified peptide precursor CbpA